MNTHENTYIMSVRACIYIYIYIYIYDSVCDPRFHDVSFRQILTNACSMKLYVIGATT